MSKRGLGLTWIASAVLLLGCAHSAGTPPRTGAGRAASATLEPRSGSRLEGLARFSEERGRVTLRVEVHNAPPGEHAIHLHEKGDCSAPDAASAGAHWNPTDSAHGAWGHSPYHLGDIGNLTVAADGSGSMSLSTELWTIGGGANNDIVGRSVVIHAAEDDFTTQPSGAAGGRIGCGVIQTTGER